MRAEDKLIQLRRDKQQLKADWDEFMHQIIDIQYQKAQKIVLVMDSLNAHSPASFYEVFTPEEAERREKRHTSSSDK